MIPSQLRLKNFFSYRDASLDFRGLHTACICGENGAGKSSLLEAIAWAIWGKSRAATEDDVIHVGEMETQVDFIFHNQQQIYRVIRRRVRGQSSSLELQVETPNGFRALTGKGVRATQQLLLDAIKLDYDTFINSAYLRQGRADEFMLKSPKERKQILADLLKLDRYDELSEKAKDTANQAKGQAEFLKQSLDAISEQLQQGETLNRQVVEAETAIAQLQQQQDDVQQQFLQLQTQQNQRQAWLQQLDWHRQQLNTTRQEQERQQQELANARQRLQTIDRLLQQEAEITAGYQQFEQLQAQDEAYTVKWNAERDAQTRKSAFVQQLTQRVYECQRQQDAVQGQLAALVRQEQSIQKVLGKAEEIEAGLAQLQQAKERLNLLDRLQLQVSPLMQRKIQLQTECDRARSQLEARLEQLESQSVALAAQHAQMAQLQQTLADVTVQIAELEKKQVYRQRVHEKGLERRSFIERLKAHQGDYAAQMEEMERKIQMLQVPDAICPLCDRSLDEQHWDLVSRKHATQHQELMHQVWLVKEQLAVSEQEIKVLRQNYSELSQELAGYESLREYRGQLVAQLDANDRDGETLQRLQAEQARVQQQLAAQEYAVEAQAELAEIDRRLQELEYDDKDHALARGLVERWRWAEIKQAELRSAQKQQAQIQEQRPEFEQQIGDLQRQMEALQTESELARQIVDLDRYIARLDYRLEEHNAVRSALKEAQEWLRRSEELRSAKIQAPQVGEQIAALEMGLERSRQGLESLGEQVAMIQKQLADTPDRTREIEAIGQQIQQRRLQLDGYFAQLGGLQQQQQQLRDLRSQLEVQRQQWESACRRHLVYSELSRAFGKNGIQALMIENVLPELEAETNRILSRLSANQLHVQFVTQRATKGSKKTSKLIDTLDILIADARGTRPYETYSGGEAFRINFAIRLALAQLLAQRSGTTLQMLIVDEGFGTQDDQGCERLVAAIEAISVDFACILAVTHIPHLKEAFQTRIEVRKTEDGSQIHLSI
jgi:exonuclease SbcC